jgi:uncharacterized membrane protein YphA (DoxX/SURF4 family)
MLSPRCAESCQRAFASSRSVKSGALGAVLQDATIAASSKRASHHRQNTTDILYQGFPASGHNERRVNTAVLVVRVVVGAILVAAGALKVGQAASLAAAIAGFRLLPATIAGPLAIGLPYFELLVGAYLVFGLFTRGAAVVAAVQFVLYAAAIASAVVRHIPANCGCFGPADSAVADWPHVVVDGCLAVAAAFVAFGAPGALALDRKLRAA